MLIHDTESPLLRPGVIKQNKPKQTKLFYACKSPDQSANQKPALPNAGTYVGRR